MSTAFRVTGRGVRLTRAKIESILAQVRESCQVDASVVSHDEKQGHLIVKVGPNHVHHYRAGRTDCWNHFERFGGNDPGEWIEFLNGAGYSVLSEHDAGYFK